MLMGNSLRTVSTAKVLAIVFVVACAAVASAQDIAAPPAPTPNPPPAAQAAAAAAPAAVAPAAAPDLQSCLSETGDYVSRGKAVSYVIALANSCDKRLRCEVFANVTGAKGSSQGHAVLFLGPASSGARAKKSYSMKVKAAGGIAQVSRECSVF